MGKKYGGLIGPDYRPLSYSAKMKISRMLAASRFSSESLFVAYVYGGNSLRKN